MRRSHSRSLKRANHLDASPREETMKGSISWVAIMASLLLLTSCESGETAAPAAGDDGNQVDGTIDGIAVDGTIDGSVDGSVNVDGTIDGNIDGTVADGVDAIDGGTDGTDGSTEPEKPTWGTPEYWKTFFFPNGFVLANQGVNGRVYNIDAFEVGNTDEIVIVTMPLNGEKAVENPCLGTEGSWALVLEDSAVGTAFPYPVPLACMQDDAKLVIAEPMAIMSHYADFTGTFEEKLVATGMCDGGKADGARQCTRFTDCDDLEGASCKGLSIEFWIHITYNEVFQDNTKELVTEDYVLDPTYFRTE